MPTKLQQFKKFSQNPELETFRMLGKMKEDLKKDVMDQDERIVRNIVANPELITALLGSVGKAIKGNDGYTPKTGVDFYTEKDIQQVIAHIESQIRVPIPEDGIDGIDGADGEDGYTPKPGIDYPTKEQCKEMVTQEVYKLFSVKPENDKIITKEEIQVMIGKVQEKADFKERAAEIARALETLKGNDRLDYEALKNRPGTPAYDTSGKIYARGGGSEVKYYDLSSLTDGVTKVFTIPSNKRVAGVFGSDVPAGNYRPVVDWTSSGTQLTLTSDVMAPSTGATLWIIYVPH